MKRFKLIMTILIIAAVIAAAADMYIIFFYGGPAKPAKPVALNAESVIEQPSATTPSDAHVHGAAPAQPEPQADITEEPPVVEISYDKLEVMGVKTVEAKPDHLSRVIRTVGRVGYDETKLTTINIKFEGWIEKLYIDYTGKLVKKGDPIAEIYSPELVATQQEFINISKWAKESVTSDMVKSDADNLLEGAKRRLGLWDINESQIASIERTGKPIRTLTIYSPVGGYVVAKNAIQGMRAMAGEKLFDIADLSTVWLMADIYEFELPMVHLGETADITMISLPGEKFRAKIDYIYPTLSEATRTVKVRLSIPNPGYKLKPEMYSNVEINISHGRRLSIPAEAVIDTGKRHVVYVDKGDGYFEPREVQLGLKGDTLVEVTKGLKPGDRVASSANFLIDSEARLRGVVR